MEKYIELINAYLNKTLSQSEVLAFENKLQSDAEFNTIYNEHLVILNGISRVELKAEINDARQSYVRGKWLKYLGISIVIIIVSILAYSLITTSQNSATSNPSKNNTVEFVLDSTRTEQIEIVEISTDTVSTEKVITKNKFETTSDEAIVDVIYEKGSKNSTGNNLISFYKSVKKQPQKITINTAENFKITLKEGTIISIPKNAFVIEKTSEEVSGNIELNITEYYKLYDMLLADLITKSNDRILETGGMLYVDARKNGSKLKLKPEAEMNIVFNTSGKRNMQLFSGEKNIEGINWTLAEQQKTITTKETESIDYITVSNNKDPVVPFTALEVVPIYPGCENENDKRKCISDAINKFISKKFDTSIADDLNITGKQKIWSSFEIDKEGNIGKIEVRASHKVMAEEAIRVLELLPKVIPGKQNGKAVNVKYKFPLVYTIIGNENKRRTNQEQDSIIFTMKSDNGFIEKFEGKPIALINNSDLERYTFATTNLGWLNCDRFVNSRKKKIKYKIKIKDSEGANVKMIFKSMSSILPSYRIDENYSFGEIPIDEEVILFAIKKKDDKLFLGMKEVTTKTVSELDLEFKEVTIAELKTELYNLNEGF